MFKRGFKAVDEEKERQEKNKQNRGKALWKFYLAKDKDEADLTFLTSEPINFYSHNIKSYVNGKERFDEIPCVGENCKYCKQGEKTTFKSAWLVVDHREFKYKDKDGKEQTGSDQVRLFIYGTKIASQLDRIAKKYGLENRVLTMIRMGTGTSTTYTFERGDKNVLSPKEIEELLPEALRKEYEGTEESLYDILENQILMLAGEEPEDDEDEDDDVDETIVPLDDDDDDEDEEEEERPKKSKVKKLGGKKGKREHRVKKTSIKNLVKAK